MRLGAILACPLIALCLAGCSDPDAPSPESKRLFLQYRSHISSPGMVGHNDDEWCPHAIRVLQRAGLLDTVDCVKLVPLTEDVKTFEGSADASMFLLIGDFHAKIRGSAQRVDFVRFAFRSSRGQYCIGKLPLSKFEVVDSKDTRTTADWVFDLNDILHGDEDARWNNDDHKLVYSESRSVGELVQYPSTKVRIHANRQDIYRILRFLGGQ